MTSAERMLLAGLRSTAAQFSTTGAFSLSSKDGALGTFHGVIDEQQNQLDLVAGGQLAERGITIDAEMEQFTDADVTPELGMTVTVAGVQYTISRMPFQRSSAYSYRFECDRAMNARAR